MVAKASSCGSPVKNRSGKDVYAPWEMTEHEKELTTKCIQLIQGHIPSRVSFIFILFLSTLLNCFLT